MERLEGESLKERMARVPLDFESLLRLAVDIADALEAAHGAGIVHRDIKPGNIFLTARGHAKLLDFGLAKVGAPAPSASSQLVTQSGQDLVTSPGLLLGTVAYMSPEQARGERLDARSDLFSFGIVLYEMAAHALPFHGPTSAVVFHEILGSTPVRPSLLNPVVPAALDALIMKELEKDREVSYQRAADMRSHLQAQLRGHQSSTEVVPAVAAAAISRDRELADGTTSQKNWLATLLLRFSRLGERRFTPHPFLASLKLVTLGGLGMVDR
jgi:serine/threonine protein kinase